MTHLAGNTVIIIFLVSLCLFYYYKICIILQFYIEWLHLFRKYNDASFYLPSVILHSSFLQWYFILASFSDTSFYLPSVILLMNCSKQGLSLRWKPVVYPNAIIKREITVSFVYNLFVQIQVYVKIQMRIVVTKLFVCNTVF